MAISPGDVIPLSQARANLSELADQVKAGAEKVITENGEGYVAIIDARRLDYYHQLERERIHLPLIDDASQGLADVAAGRTRDAHSTTVCHHAPPRREVGRLTDSRRDRQTHCPAHRQLRAQPSRGRGIPAGSRDPSGIRFAAVRTGQRHGISAFHSAPTATVV
jgi:prevent-host-death family protein